jgi:TRAP-type C4-dicarboxylate transport system permease large subunit
VSVFDPEPVRHPDDHVDSDETGPWLAILSVCAVGWVALALVDWRLLSEGTFLWATARSLYTLILAPLAAAALLQDTRTLGVEGVEFGLLKWAYAGIALFFPPVGGVYLCHRRVVVDRRSSPPECGEP